MSTNPKARAWVEIDADALRKNYADIQAGVGSEARVLPMVKANAYGLGVEEVVRTLEPEEPWGYGVATLDEALELQALGVARPVVVMSPLPPGQVPEAVAAGLHLSVSSLEAVEQLHDEAARQGVRAFAHVDVDTGMGRSGFDDRALADWLEQLGARADEHLVWAGLFTHLHSADEGPASIGEQWGRLEPVAEVAVERAPGIAVHVLNSAGVFRAPERANSLVRPGIYLYGGAIGPDQPEPTPVVSVRARVVHVREVGAGATLGYGATYVASGGERWATLAIGYGDGLPRALGNRGSALLAGRRVPVIGRISMDVTVVDITGIPGVEAGDVATLIGSEGEEIITVDDVAREAGTISYEILTGLTPRLPRVWSAAA